MVIVAAAVAQAQVDALEMAGKGARIEFFGGLPKSDPYARLHTNLIHYREITVSGSFSQKIDDLRASMRLIDGGGFPADKITTHRFAVDDILPAFREIIAGRAIKVCIRPGN